MGIIGFRGKAGVGQATFMDSLNSNLEYFHYIDSKALFCLSLPLLRNTDQYVQYETRNQLLFLSIYQKALHRTKRMIIKVHYRQLLCPDETQPTHKYRHFSYVCPKGFITSLTLACEQRP